MCSFFLSSVFGVMFSPRVSTCSTTVQCHSTLRFRGMQKDKFRRATTVAQKTPWTSVDAVAFGGRPAFRGSDRQTELESDRIVLKTIRWFGACIVCLLSKAKI